LDKLVSEGQLTRLWQADQVSMNRTVMLEMLKREAAADPAWIKAFLADVRAKALVKHPGIGAVYEAVSDDDATYFARERLDGADLEELHDQGKQYKPVEVVILLDQIATAMRHLEAMGMATVEMGLHHIIIDQDLTVRMMNLAVDGKPEVKLGTKAKQLLGAVFDDMLIRGEPGAVRVNSLLGFMADLEREHPLSWRQIQELSQQVREQLEGTDDSVTEAQAPVTQPVEVAPVSSSNRSATIVAIVAGVLILGAFIFFISQGGSALNPDIDDSGDRAADPVWISIPAGPVEIQGGRTVILEKDISVSKTEVTLSQYARFLDELEIGGPAVARSYDHPQQPPEKFGHFPDDWDNLWGAAQKSGEWNGRRIFPQCPVVGIDWWDAWAYCKWEGSRLLTMDEWAAAAHYEGAPEKISSWGPADSSPDDLTGVSLVGMAGNVREWTRDPELNPAFQLDPKKPVAVGGSFKDPGQGVASREWLKDRNVRRPDLGFRTAH